MFHSAIHLSVYLARGVVEGQQDLDDFFSVGNCFVEFDSVVRAAVSVDYTWSSSVMMTTLTSAVSLLIGSTARGTARKLNGGKHTKKWNNSFFVNSHLPTLSSTCTVNVKYPSMELVGVKAAVMMPVL